MYRSIAATALSAALFATTFGPSLSSVPAVAYDDDVDVVCFDYEGASGSETECQTIEQLTAECALTDPEFTTDVCGGLLESRRPLGLTTTSGTPTKEKHRRDNDRGKGRDHNDGGGNNGGGNSGGGNSGGGSGRDTGGRGNGGGSGPNG